MVNSEIYYAITALNDAPHMAYLACTGAGAGLQAMLQEVPGASATLLGARMPYDRMELIDFLGWNPPKFVGEHTSLRMATAAYHRAKELLIRSHRKDLPAIGFGITAAVATGRPRRGAEQAFLATRTDDGLRSVHVEFTKGALSRADEGHACDLLGLNEILSAAGCPTLPLPNHMKQAVAMKRNESAGDFGRESESPVGLVIEPDGHRSSTELGIVPDRDVLFCGSFNPWHPGHDLMAKQAEMMTGRPVICVITDTHPTKGRIPDRELWRRARQFSFHRPVAFTSGDGLFVEKAERFSGATFLVGYDVALGILDPRFYSGSDSERDAVLGKFARLGTSFLVCGRTVKDPGGKERFMQADSLPVPLRFAGLFTPVTGRMDISSTELR